MNNDEFKKQFLTLFPEFKILSQYKNTHTKILVEDDLGIRYNILPGTIFNRAAKPSSRNTVDLLQYYKIKLKQVFPNLEILNLGKTRNHIIVKEEDGCLYEILAAPLLSGSYPGWISAVNKKENFINKANKIHNYKYDYSLVKYLGANLKVDIICPIHGKFEQVINSHLLGYGCLDCSDRTGFSRTRWINFCETSPEKTPKTYIIRFFNNNENFIKIGITTQKLSTRFKNISYSYEVLKEIKGSPDFIWDKEKELHRLCKNYKYKPLISFDGHTECFTLEVLSLLDL